MCTVFGYWGKGLDKNDIRKCLAATITRGPDDERILELNGQGFLGFQRLAIMDLSESGMQPFELSGSAVVCNGEIYGFRPMKEELLKKGYGFRSDSDCEILLPLYREYGTKMFGMLDAEYASSSMMRTESSLWLPGIR